MTARTTTAFERIVDALRDAGSTVIGDDHKAKATCPSHDDSQPSLSVGRRRDGKGAVLTCHAGCDYRDILAAIGLTERDLFDDNALRDALRPNADYRYKDGRIKHRRATPDGGKKMWQSGDLSGESLYGVEHLRDTDTTVYLCEGEKGAEALRALGVATVATGGAQRSCDMSPLAGRDVLAVVDRDDSGRDWAKRIRAELDGVAGSVRFLQSKADLPKADVVEHISMDLALTDLAPLTLEVDAAPDTAERNGRDTDIMGCGVSYFDSPPIPFTRSSRPPMFPVDALPATVGHMVAAVAHATQTDPAMAATSALTVLAACAGGHAEVEIRSGWREPMCLYTVTVAGPGERKSAVQAALTRPILDVEQRLAAAGAHSRLEAETLKQIAIKDAERTRNAAASAKEHDQRTKLQAEAIGAVATAEAITVPVVPRMVADDVTPEAAATLLADHGGKLAIISAEGGIFDIIAGRYSKAIPNMDLWLKGHSGDPIKVDRKGRAPEYIRRPALTLGLMVQPAVLAEIARHPSFRGRGLLARILYAMPVSKVGTRQIAPDPVQADIGAAYEKLVGELAEGLAGWSGDPAVLMLTREAEQAVRQLESDVEPTLAGNGSLAPLADWGAKYVGAVVRIAGLLHLAQHGHERGVMRPISADVINDAARIGDYYRASAIQAFDAMATDAATADAAYLAEKVATVDGDTVSARDLLRVARRFKTRGELDPVIARLVEHDYLRPIPMPQQTGIGRPPSQLYKVSEYVTNATKGTQTSA